MAVMKNKKKKKKNRLRRSPYRTSSKGRIVHRGGLAHFSRCRPILRVKKSRDAATDTGRAGTARDGGGCILRICRDDILILRPDIRCIKANCLYLIPSSRLRPDAGIFHRLSRSFSSVEWQEA